MENTKGMTICKICGREFSLTKEEHYTSKEAGKTGIAAIAGGPAPILWDSFDCPYCGCQNNMQQRNRVSDIFGNDFHTFDSTGENCCCCSSDACELDIGEQK